MSMKTPKEPASPTQSAKPQTDWLKQKQMRQKPTFPFGKGSISKVGFHGTQHRG